MDKVIINGVNVSECDVYIEGHCKDKTALMFCDTNLCSNFPYCYYKQLQRAKAENEELKNDILNGVMCITCPDKNENCQLQAENEHYRKEAYRLADGLNKTENLAFTYKQALQEIREMARHEVETRMLFADKKSFCDFNIILANINEVIGAE